MKMLRVCRAVNVVSLQAVDVDVRFCSSGKGEGLKYLLGTAL